MARKPDPNSVRQRAFNMLDNMTNVKREKALDVLKQTFGIGDSYAATLHAAHRTINKQKGVMVKTFVIRDIKDGKPVKPYLKVINTFKPEKGACRTLAAAVKAYREQQTKKIEIAENIC